MLHDEGITEERSADSDRRHVKSASGFICQESNKSLFSNNFFLPSTLVPSTQVSAPPFICEWLSINEGKHKYLNHGMRRLFQIQSLVYEYIFLLYAKTCDWVISCAPPSQSCRPNSTQFSALQFIHLAQISCIDNDQTEKVGTVQIKWFRHCTVYHESAEITSAEGWLQSRGCGVALPLKHFCMLAVWLVHQPRCAWACFHSQRCE